ncbi:D-2-hydroxyacid dehydrogenase family protein [Agrobacterium larrymoorei]|uniref:D-2-hydroxyacid dehydrogenase family protein n=1 Tax=Agrobacterium larrymoorei TaxID=160699 RepID=A0AAF0HCP0_9HYPH|nr:D-2-hydroxyacid dehydrogenase family protein [Agrobacterium larrymoorei]WHA44011.1 D-2-hydroxyacid dehydrogenase family protein [Agrobacterium larrymoorei]
MKIAILDDYQNVSQSYADWTNLKRKGEVVVFNDHISDPEELKGALAPFDAVCLMRERTPLGKDLIEALPNLKLIVTAGARNAAIDMAAAKERGITVCGTRRSGASAAELAVTLIMALARNLVTEARSMQDGGWQVGVGKDVKGTRLGIIGLGNLGAEVARVGKALGMDVCAWSTNLTPERCTELGVTYLSKEELLETSDFISIHLVLSERTRHLLGAADFKSMKSSAYLVNTSRADIVDTEALLAALDARELAGAAIDVYSTEPLPRDSRLRTHPRVLATPHIGYVTENAYRTFYTDFVEDIEAFLDGSPVRVL